MNEQDQGVAATPPGLRLFEAEPATQSQAEPLVPNAEYALPCIVCRQSLRNLWGQNQPSGGCEFSSPGHYGTEAFDPMDGSILAVNICDGCLVAASASGLVLHVGGGRKPQLWRLARVIEDEDAPMRVGRAAPGLKRAVAMHRANTASETDSNAEVGNE